MQEATTRGGILARKDSLPNMILISEPTHALHGFLGLWGNFRRGVWCMPLRNETDCVMVCRMWRATVQEQGCLEARWSAHGALFGKFPVYIYIYIIHNIFLFLLTALIAVAR